MTIGAGGAGGGGEGLAGFLVGAGVAFGVAAGAAAASAGAAATALGAAACTAMYVIDSNTQAPDPHCYEQANLLVAVIVRMEIVCSFLHKCQDRQALTAAGVAFGVAAGVAVGDAGAAASVVAAGVAVGAAGAAAAAAGVVSGVAVGVPVGVVDGVEAGVASGVAEGVLEGVAVGVVLAVWAAGDNFWRDLTQACEMSERQPLIQKGHAEYDHNGLGQQCRIVFMIMATMVDWQFRAYVVRDFRQTMSKGHFGTDLPSVTQSWAGLCTTWGWSWDLP